MPGNVRITAWNEFYHEQDLNIVKQIYQDGIHRTLGSYLERQPGFEVVTATLYDPDQGLRTRLSRTRMCLSGGRT